MTDEIAERLPYKEEVTGSNPVAPLSVEFNVLISYIILNKIFDS